MEKWIKQIPGQHTFPDILWNKPERKDQAGKLLIVGGNLHGFASPAKAFELATGFGIGQCRIVLPDSLKRTLHAFWTDAIFCPSTPSGSFSRKAIDLILQNTQWADRVLIVGDLGRNSETAMLLDDILRSTLTPITITKDALDYYLARPKPIFERPNTLVVASFSQLQKLLSAFGNKNALRYSMNLGELEKVLGELTQHLPVMFVTEFNNRLIASLNGSGFVSLPKDDIGIWRLTIASKASVYTIQHSNELIKALYTACEL